MFYLKLFLLYSTFGFYFESFVFKCCKENKHSGILNGPYALVYGLGGIISYLINNLLNRINNPFFNFLLCYLSFVIICTIIEFISGHLIKLIFKKDAWNYSNHKYHFGKYICLSYALFWGVLSLFFVKYLNFFFNQILIIIPNYIPIILLIIIFFDFLFQLIMEYK